MKTKISAMMNGCAALIAISAGLALWNAAMNGFSFPLLLNGRENGGVKLKA